MFVCARVRVCVCVHACVRVCLNGYLENTNSMTG